jgi:hypothetical protein
VIDSLFLKSTFFQFITSQRLIMSNNAHSNNSYGAFWTILGLLAFIVAGFLMAMNHSDNDPARVIRNDGYTKMYSTSYNPFKQAAKTVETDSAHVEVAHPADAHGDAAHHAEPAQPVNKAPEKKGH